jgi:helix-turn-helix protein/putative peptidoglycan binding protein
VIASAQTDRFAAYLRLLKERSGRGFERLGKQAGASGSSLHRYCSGLSVPSDYRVVHAFAKVCGASAEELRELHRLWALADAVRATPPQEPAEEEKPVGKRLPRWYAVAAAAVLVTGGLVWFASEPPADPGPHADRLLFSPACRAPVGMGQHDECVAEVQGLISRSHSALAVDGDFGPETLRRVTAFQVLAGVTPRGVVDADTKGALYDQRVSMATWSPSDVEREVREVFTEDPETAVAIARCASFLDPLWVLPNTDGSRNWGVFQISDARLRELDGTPLRAFDPTWNIEAAHRLWSARRDFHDWPSCRAAVKAPS